VVRAAAAAQAREPVMPPRRPRQHPPPYDRDLYPLRPRSENAFLAFTQWRGVATR